MGARDTIAKLLMGKVGGPWEGGIRAYHSSPHDFDRFDWSKLRTGEGANSYGTGFYAAENPKVSGQGGEYWNQFLQRFSGPEEEAAQILKYTGFDREKAAELLQKRAGRKEVNDPSSLADQVNSIYADQTRKAEQLLRRGAPVGPRTYEVNINARPELLLDWDKPLSKQPQIVEKLPALVEGAGREAYDRALAATSKPRADELWGMAKDPLQATGEFAYGRLAPRDFNRASDMLREAGIPGIRYLDQGSRPTGGGMTSAGMTLAEPRKTYNYVVTDPSKLDIMAKYGIVGGAPVGMGALAAQDQYGTQP